MWLCIEERKNSWWMVEILASNDLMLYELTDKKLIQCLMKLCLVCGLCFRCSGGDVWDLGTFTIYRNSEVLE